ncbi:MAG: NADH-quinone oxidoreductase subunit NuoG [Actinomycetota bacterium]
MLDAIKVTVNGVELETEPGRMLIDVAEEAGVFVPRFCYHPGLESVAACRMCLVQIEGSKRPLEPACATAVTDGMVVTTDSDSAVAAQKSVLEMLLINHPLDCPICDKGGECPLQDQALSFGPGSSRYVDEKRHFTKPLPISNLILLDRERCVLCWRCSRFCDEVSGDRFIDLMDRGSHTQINAAPEEPFDSYFSGNTIQICPVGALTSTSYRFMSRPWDLGKASSTCSYCSVGCPLSIEHRDGKVLRAQAIPNENVNGFWSCDKGRFGHRYVSHPDRLHAPLVNGRETTWDEALTILTERLFSIMEVDGPASIGLIGGSHATNEDLFAASAFFRDAIGTPNLDMRTFDAHFAYESCVADGALGSSATLDDLDTAKTIVWFGPDPKEELPVLYLRLRQAVKNGARLVIVHPRRISLSELGHHVDVEPGHEVQALRDLVIDEGDAVVCIGQQFIGRSATHAVTEAMKLVSGRADTKLLLCVPNNNSQGALDMGVYPAFSSGLSATEMLRRAGQDQFRLLWLMGADLVKDFPDKALVERAMSSDTFIVVSELFPTATARLADMVLPARSFAEKEGSFTNLEGRLQKVDPAVDSPGVARADWQIFDDVAIRLGRGWEWTSAAQIFAHDNEYSWAGLGTSGERPPADSGAWPFSWELRAVDAKMRTGRIRSAAADKIVIDVDPPSPASLPIGHLALLVGRTLYDGGAMVSRSPELRNVTPEPFVELHPDEAAVRRLADGASVTVRSARGAVTVKLRVSDATPVGCAFMLHDQGEIQANTLLDVDDPFPHVEVSA